MRSLFLTLISFGLLLGHVFAEPAIDSTRTGIIQIAQASDDAPTKPKPTDDASKPTNEENSSAEDATTPPSSVDPALLKELLERLAKVENELRKIKGEKANNGDDKDKPSIYALLESPYIGSTNYDPTNGIRYFATKMVYINLGAEPITIKRDDIELDVDGAASKLNPIPPELQYQSFQIDNQQYQFQNLGAPEQWTIPPGGTTSVWMLFTDLPRGSLIPSMNLKTRFGEKVLELDVNQFALGALQLTVERIGPQNSLGLLTIGGKLDTINLGSLMDELDSMVANRVMRVVISFDESAPALDNQLFYYFQQVVNFAGRNNVNFDPRYPPFPTALREVHFCQLPAAEEHGLYNQNPNNVAPRIHKTISEAVNAALRSAYEVLPRDELVREIETGHPLTRAAALANGGGRLSSEYLPMILKHADDNDAGMQMAALTALRHFGEPEAVEKLLYYVRKNVEPLSFIAIDSLADSRFATAHEALLEVLKNEPPTSKKTIVQVLAQHPRPIWAETIYEFANGPAAEYTPVALQALARIGHPKLLEVLRNKLEKGDPQLQEIALSILVDKGDADSERLALEYTLARLEKHPPTQKMIELIHRTKDRRVLPFLFKFFDEIPDQRSQLIGMIALLGDEDAIDFLVERYEKLQPQDQSVVLGTLRQIQSPHFLPLAGQALLSQDMSLVNTACQVLQADAGPEAVNLLVEAFEKSENNNTWSYIGNTLSNLGNPSVLKVLEKTRRSNNKTKSQIARNSIQRIRQRSPGYPYIYQASQSLRESKLDDALDKFNLAIKLDPQLPDAYAGRGNIYLQQSKLTEASADFRKALELDEYNSQSITGLCVIQVMEGKIDEGIKTIEKEREKFDSDSLFAYNAACVYGRAIEHLQKQDATPERDQKIAEYQQTGIEQLRKSVQLGFGDLEWMKKDPDLNTLHEAPGFQEIINGNVDEVQVEEKDGVF